MKSINMIIALSFLMVNFAIYASSSDNETTQFKKTCSTLYSLISAYKKNQDDLQIYQKAKDDFENTEKKIKLIQQNKKTVPTDLITKHSAAESTWYGKPWILLTEDEKNKNYPPHRDLASHLNKAWNELNPLDQTLYNRDNKQLRYYGQCSKMYTLNSTTDELKKDIQENCAVLASSSQELIFNEDTRQLIKKDPFLMKIPMLNNAATTDLVVYKSK